jgi:hypothetical protein
VIYDKERNTENYPGFIHIDYPGSHFIHYRLDDQLDLGVAVFIDQHCSPDYQFLYDPRGGNRGAGTEKRKRKKMG